MAEGLSKIRDRIHRKSHDYFVFEYGRREPTKWKMFYGATDALLDAGTAAASYDRIADANTGSRLLACYGFLQALYVQQDAVQTLSDAVGLHWHPNMDQRLKEIRDIRNRLTGHPAKAGDKTGSRRLSSAIISHDSVTQHGFRGHVYYYDGMENIEIDVVSFLNDNESRLAIQMDAIEKQMDQEERQFRIEQAARPLSSCLGNNFDYLIQRLHCDLTDESRTGQAQTHAKMIREIMATLRETLAKRGFESTATLHYLDIINKGLDLLEQVMCRASPSREDQIELDLLCDGLEKNIDSVRILIGEIDTKLRTPV